MTVITPIPLLMRDATFTVESDDYIAAISSAEFTPNGGIATFKGLTPSAVFSAAQSSTWTCALTFVQDWESVDSLSRYLFENEGSEIDVVFAPNAGGTPISATLIVTPGSIGGAVDGYATSTVQLGVVGRPTLGTPDSPA